MAPGRLRECTPVAEERWDARLASRRVEPVDEPRERIERDVLGESQSEREPPRTDGHPAPGPVEDEAEDEPVQCVEPETDEAPASPGRDGLAEEGDIGVVAAEGGLVERLL